MRGLSRLLRRLTVGLATVAVVATLTAAVTPVRNAQASPVQSTQSDVQAAGARPRLTLADLQKNLRSYHLGPLKASGYGRARLWTLKSAGKYGKNTKLSVGLKYGNYDPRRTLTPEGADAGSTDGGIFRPDGSKVMPDGTVVPASEFCWPWEDHGPGSACWNNPATWNWGHIWNNIAGSPDKNIYTSWARMQKCGSGALTGTFGAFGTNAVAGLSVFSKLQGFLAVTPGKFIFGVVRGCIFTIFK